MSKQVENEKARLNILTGFIYGVVLFQRGESDPHTVQVDLSKLTKESALSHMCHGIKQRVNDAAAMPAGTSRDERIAAAEAAALAIETNASRTRATGFDERQSLAITIYVAKKYSGKLPKGGRALVWENISGLAKPKADAFWKHVDAMLEGGTDW